MGILKELLIGWAAVVFIFLSAKACFSKSDEDIALDMKDEGFLPRD